MNEEALRDRLVDLLDGEHAHVGFERVIAAVEAAPAELRGQRPAGLSHSPWELLEHLRIAQKDILEFSRDPEWVSPEWPEGYWPEEAVPGPGAWEESLEAFRNDLEEMKELVRDPERDLFHPFPWGDGQNLLREAMLVADHNAYHVGQLVDAARLLGAWPPRSEAT